MTLAFSYFESSEWNAKNSSGAHSIESVAICHIVSEARPWEGYSGKMPSLTVGLLTRTAAGRDMFMPVS